MQKDLNLLGIASQMMRQLQLVDGLILIFSLVIRLLWIFSMAICYFQDEEALLAMASLVLCFFSWIVLPQRDDTPSVGFV